MLSSPLISNIYFCKLSQTSWSYLSLNLYFCDYFCQGYKNSYITFITEPCQQHFPSNQEKREKLCQSHDQ